MNNELYIYSGAGNLFVVMDGRDERVVDEGRIRTLCGKYSTDGLMILRNYNGYDFGMEYYNPDGSGGMMCGNGGRCITAFASRLGIRPSDGKEYHFLAADGEHTARILDPSTVRLKMKDVDEFRPALDGEFIDTGTRHFVKFVPDVEEVDVYSQGRRYRYDPVFAPVGANANFVQVLSPDTLKVRTYEKGVERETLACGTGITASAIAAYLALAPSEGPVSYAVEARQDSLKVEFTPVPGPDGGVKCFREVYLTGPVKLLQTRGGDICQYLL